MLRFGIPYPPHAGPLPGTVHIQRLFQRHGHLCDAAVLPPGSQVVYTYTHARTHARTQARTHAHTHIQTFTHTYTNKPILARHPLIYPSTEPQSTRCGLGPCLCRACAGFVPGLCQDCAGLVPGLCRCNSVYIYNVININTTFSCITSYGTCHFDSYLLIIKINKARYPGWRYPAIQG